MYRAAGAPGLSNELERDVSRLWRRNLGRDDRLIADSGRELRTPFLVTAIHNLLHSLHLTQLLLCVVAGGGCVEFSAFTASV